MDNNQPLKGVRVLDASTILAAPLVSALLGDFGAEVVKVEHPVGGDPIRQYPPNVDGQPVGTKVTNRNKKSVTLDLSTERGSEIFKRLVPKFDVVVANFRPDTLTKWGIDYENLRAVNPELVMLHLSGFGRTGAYRNRPGFARVAEAFGGLTYITGSPDGPPVFAGYPVADGVGGIYGAFSVMLALYHRSVTGVGQLVDLALYEPIIRMMEDLMIGYDAAGSIRERHGNINPHVAPNDIYKSRDGKWLALPSSTPNMFKRLCMALEMFSVLDDERFKDNDSRVAHRADLDALLRPVIESYDAERLTELLIPQGVAVQVVNNAADINADPHVWERESLVKVWDEGLGREVTMPGVIPKLSESPGSIQNSGPDLGQHTSDILSGLLDLTADDIQQLRADNII